MFLLRCLSSWFAQVSLSKSKFEARNAQRMCLPGVIVALVGNKLDLAESHRDVPTEVSLVTGFVANESIYFDMEISMCDTGRVHVR